MSRLIAVGLAALLLAACRPAAESAAPAQPQTPAAPSAEEAARQAVWDGLENRYIGMETAPADPIDAVEWREVHCNFLAGEFGGDNSEQDRAVNARMDELRCGEDLLADVRALRESHVTDTATLARLDALLARQED